jgi:aerobic carbon-monoxide dehydrogenase medium subunit
VIPAEFDYAVADSVEGAISLLDQGGEDAKLLAGGHSLLPLMKLRLAAPSLLIDLRKVPGLSGIERANGGFRVGPMTRHAELAASGELPGAVTTAAQSIADQQVRNRGTIGGSLAHGDPASDLPAVMLAFEGSLSVQGPSGSRDIAAADMFQDYLTTAIEPTEVITSISIPALEGYGYGYEKFARRAEDWAMVGVVALVKSNGGTCEDVRIGLTHMGSTPLRATAAEQALRGQPLSPESIAAAAEQAAEGTDPPADLNATQEYKRHLARVLTRRALEAAAG